MRELLFRGKAVNGIEWIYGYYYKIIDKHYLLDKWNESDGFGMLKIIREVIPETVGQYTGLKDKNGVKIFEGDIVTHMKGFVWTVIFNKETASFGLITSPRTSLVRPVFFDRMKHCEVIGTVHE